MAFMMPVMKNNYDIYKDTRSRKTSECSTASGGGGGGGTTLASALGTPAHGSASAGHGQQRRRKVSECKSESFATSPSHGQLGAHRLQMQRCHSSRGFTRNPSRTSTHNSMMAMHSNSYAAGMGSTSNNTNNNTQAVSALEKQAAAAAAGKQSGSANSNDYTKFHLRLVDKLRKSFRKDSGKRS